MKLLTTAAFFALSLNLFAGTGFEVSDNGGIDKSFKQKLVLIDENETDPYEKETKVRIKIDYTKWVPSNPNGVVIVYNHGMQSHRGWFTKTANSLKKTGYTVYAFDRIGSGTSGDGVSLTGLGRKVEKRGHINSYKTFLKTIDQFLDIVKNENENSDIILWGNSYGAKLTTAYVLKYGQKNVDGLIFTTPGLYPDKMPLPFKITQILKARNSKLFPTPIFETDGDNGASLFTSMPEWFEKIKTDKLSLREVTKGFYFATKSLDAFIAANSPGSVLSDIPKLYLMVEGDPMMNNEKMITHINQNIESGNTVVKFYEGGADHRHFLPFTEDSDEMITDIVKFLTVD